MEDTFIGALAETGYMDKVAQLHRAGKLKLDAAGAPHIPPFPGMEDYFNKATGLTLEQVRQFIIKQKKSRGFAFNTKVGSQKVPVNLSGEARFLLGFGFDPGPGTDGALIPLGAVTLTVNNEVIVDGQSANTLNIGLILQEYYSFPRYLSGQDTIILNVGDTVVRAANVVFYYI